MKTLFLLVSLTISLYLSAQQKFIEVTVSDTVLAEANQFVYRITFIPDEIEYDEMRYKNPALFAKKMEQRRERTQQAYDSLKAVLGKDGFAFLPLTADDMFMVTGNSSEKIPQINVLLHSLNDLSRLYNRIHNAKNIIGALQMSAANDESAYQKKLHQKLIDAAIAKAKNLADDAKLSIQGVQSIIENKPDTKQAGGWTAYPPLSALSESQIPGWHTSLKNADLILITGKDINNMYAISGSITMRFLTE